MTRFLYFSKLFNRCDELHPPNTFSNPFKLSYIHNNKQTEKILLSSFVFVSIYQDSVPR